MSGVAKTAAARPDDEGEPGGFVTGAGAVEAPAVEAPAVEAPALAAPRQRRVPLDWDGLERALMRPAVGAESCLDTHSGEVIELIDGWSDDHGFSEQELAEGLVSGRLVTIEPLPQETVQGWMATFVAGLEDSWARDDLQLALAGLAPRQSFEEALGRFPQERLAWLARREAREAAVLRAWLEAKDIAPTTERRRNGRLLT